MDVATATQTIQAAFDWSCGFHHAKPPAGWNKELIAMPDLKDVVKNFIKNNGYTGDRLDVFYWWMGVTLGILRKDVQ